MKYSSPLSASVCLLALSLPFSETLAATASSNSKSKREGPPATGLSSQSDMMGQGQWMLAYDFMLETMSGNLDGTRKVGESEVLNNFFAAPTDMTMQMHMFMGGYSLRPNLAVMAELPYLIKSMDHVTQTGERFEEKTSGFGDLELRLNFLLLEQDHHRIALSGGVSIPSGSIDERQNGLRLEYPMQLGSGSYSLLPGIAYLAETETGLNWGVEFTPSIRLDTNDNNYKLGNIYRINAWAARPVLDDVQLSLRTDARRVENIKGADPELDPMDEQTKDPNLQAGTRIDLLAGVSFQPRFLGGQNILLEAGAPVYQSLDGPQLKATFSGRVSLQWHFS